MKFKKRKIIFGATGFVLFSLVVVNWINAFFTGTVLDIFNPVTGKRSALIRRESGFLDTAVFLYVYDPQASKR